MAKIPKSKREPVVEEDVVLEADNTEVEGETIPNIPEQYLPLQKGDVFIPYDPAKSGEEDFSNYYVTYDNSHPPYDPNEPFVIGVTVWHNVAKRETSVYAGESNGTHLWEPAPDKPRYVADLHAEEEAGNILGKIINKHKQRELEISKKVAEKKALLVPDRPTLAELLDE